MRSPVADGAWIAIAALAVYALLGRDAFYKIDAQHFLYLDGLDVKNLGYHHVYVHWLAASRWLLAPWGATEFESARFASALGMALGVFGVHLLGRQLGLTRRENAITTGLTAVCPAWVFFATVVEVHGPFMPFAVLSMACSIGLARRPGLGRAALAGTVIGGAYLVHPTAVLLLALLPVWAELVRVRAVSGPNATEGPAMGPDRAHSQPFATDLTRVAFPGPLGLGHLLVAGSAAGAVIVAVPSVLEWLGAGVAAKHTIELLTMSPWTLLRGDEWPRTFWIEWLLPYCPLGWLVWWALGTPLRRAVAWLALALLPYLVVAQLFLQHGGEHGAYMLPLVPPMVLCCMPLLRRRGVLLVAFVLSATVAVVRLETFFDPESPKAYAEGFRAIAGDDPWLIIGHDRDVSAHYIHMPELRIHFLGDIVHQPDEAVSDALLASFDRLAGQHLANGGRLFVSADAWACLHEAAETGVWVLSEAPRTKIDGYPLGPRRLIAHLGAHYRLDEVVSGGFRGLEISARRSTR